MSLVWYKAKKVSRNISQFISLSLAILYLEREEEQQLAHDILRCQYKMEDIVNTTEVSVSPIYAAFIMQGKELSQFLLRLAIEGRFLLTEPMGLCQQNSYGPPISKRGGWKSCLEGRVLCHVCNGVP